MRYNAMYVVYDRIKDYYIKMVICKQLNCKTKASFGVIDTKIALFCSEHKQDNMEDINNKKCQH